MNVTVIFILLLIVLFVYASLQFYFLHRKEAELKRKEIDVYDQAEHILKSTHKRSVKIISKAVTKSNEILNQTKTFKANIEENANETVENSLQKYADELEKSSQEIAQSYQELFDQLKQDYIDYEKDKITKIEKVATQEIEEFSKGIAEKTSKYEESLSAVVATEKATVENLEKIAAEQIQHLSETIIEKAMAFQQSMEQLVYKELEATSLEVEKIKAAVAQVQNVATTGIEEFGKSISAKTGEFESVLEKKITEEIKEAEEESHKFKDVMTNIEDVGKKGIENLNEIITQTSVDYRKNLEEKINQEFEASKVEINKYKDEQMKKVQEMTEKLIRQLSVEFLGKAIKLDEHEKLLLDALEEAKKESVFTA